MNISDDNLEWLVLVTVMFGTFLGSLDRTVTNLALPKIINTFGVTVSTAGWVITAYILANSVFVPIWGKLGDTIGRKKVYLTGLGIFIGSSFLVGISWNFGSLIVFRIVQALAVSADYPTAMAILTVTFSDTRRRTQALGIWSASMASGAILGPLIGGPLIDNFGWRSIFFFNIPLGLIAIAMAVIFIKESSVTNKPVKFDISGATVLSIALFSIVFVLNKGQSWGWTSNTSLILYFIAMSALVGFYFIEQHHEDPLIDFKFFKNRTFVLILMNTFVVFMGLMGSVFLIPLFAESFLGYSATQTGYLFVPMAAALMVGAILGAKLGHKFNPGKIIASGTFVAAGGLLLFSFLDARSTAINIIAPLSIMAFGLGLGMSHRTNIIASSAPKDEIGTASSIFVLIRNIAGAFGVAIFATILSSKIENNVLNIARNTIINSKTATIFREVVSLIILKAQVSAYGSVFVIAACFVFIGGIFALFIKPKLKGKS